MVQLPVHNPIVFPSVLAGRQNGRLPASLLWPTPGQAGGPTVRLVEPAARGWRAMCAAAKTAGHILKVTSSADSYRSYEQQVATWTARYEPDNFPGSISSRVWPDHYDLEGRFVAAHRWYQKPDTAVAAYPGSSNHGWGLAADIGEESDGDAGIESLDDATLNWLIANAHLYGFSAEVQSEKWHWRRYSGDVIEPAILAYEQGIFMALTEEQQADLYRRIGNIDSVCYYGLTLAQDDLPAGSMRFGFGVGTPNAQPVPFGLMRLLHQMAANGGMSDAELEALKAELVEAVTGAVPSAEEVADATADELHDRTAE